MDPIRQPAQGIRNILRFNWHYYLIAALILSSIFFFTFYTDGIIRTALFCIGILIILSVLISLVATFYIYDCSGLYQLSWVKSDANEKTIVNIHAGFDETSLILKERFKNSKLEIFDFYNPTQHNEISIERARKAYPSLSETRKISTANIPMDDQTVDILFLIFAAHEIRNIPERNQFFNELSRIMKEDGTIYITEHVRDFANFTVYNIGFFHFQPLKTWKEAFSNAHFQIVNIHKHTPFITTFILKKNGNTL